MLKENHLPALFPNNVRFVAEDWILTPPGANKVNVILALSVLKWIHLHHLDEGLRTFFRKCARCLDRDGYLIVEVQPWKSYLQAVKGAKSPLLKKNLDLLCFRPTDFESLAEQEGFALQTRDETLPRAIEIYRKL